MNHMIDTQKLKSQISEKEWQLRLDLAATYRLIAMYGWDDLIYTHVSLRIPGPEHHFLINPYGLMFDEITASSLVKIDLNGDAVIDTPYEVNPAGFTIHSAILLQEKMHNVFYTSILMMVLLFLFKRMDYYQSVKHQCSFIHMLPIMIMRV